MALGGLDSSEFTEGIEDRSSASFSNQVKLLEGTRTRLAKISFFFQISSFTTVSQHF